MGLRIVTLLAAIGAAARLVFSGSRALGYMDTIHALLGVDPYRLHPLVVGLSDLTLLVFFVTLFARQINRGQNR